MRCAFSWATRPATANGCGPGGNPAGGDIACAVVTPHAIRLLIGDVMGHDERAARTAAQVTSAFRRLAAGQDPLQVVAARLHAFVAGHADGEEFVTAQFVSIPSNSGDVQIVCCGHPPPLLLRDGRVTALDALPPSPPLGLLDLGGCSPHADLLGARAGDSVILYTDGVSEAYDAHGLPYPLAERTAALAACFPAGESVAQHGDRLPHLPREDQPYLPREDLPDLLRADLPDLPDLPDLLRADLLDHVGGDLRDDATLLHLRFADAAAGQPAAERTRTPIARY